MLAHERLSEFGECWKPFPKTGPDQTILSWLLPKELAKSIRNRSRPPALSPRRGAREASKPTDDRVETYVACTDCPIRANLSKSQGSIEIYLDPRPTMLLLIKKKAQVILYTVALAGSVQGIKFFENMFKFGFECFEPVFLANHLRAKSPEPPAERVIL